MRHLLVSAAAVMAITGAAAVGNAQMQEQTRTRQEPRCGTCGTAWERPAQPKRSNSHLSREQKSEPRKGAEREPGRDKKPRAAQQNEPQDKSATQPQRARMSASPPTSTPARSGQAEVHRPAAPARRTSRSPPTSSASATRTSRSPPTSSASAIRTSRNRPRVRMTSRTVECRFPKRSAVAFVIVYAMKVVASTGSTGPVSTCPST